MAKAPANSLQMVFPQGVTVSFDIEEFDRQIRFHGTQFVHFRGMRCPVGIIDRSDLRQPHPDHAGCSNGFIYTRAGEVTCLFTSNGLQVRGMDAGVLDSSTVEITIPRKYDNCEEHAFVVPYDRLYLKTPDGSKPLLVPNWELVERHATGYDRLMFPAREVTDLMDNKGDRFACGTDFEVTGDGQIHWLGQNGPGLDPSTGKGRVYSIRYLYQPFWYVLRLQHEIRLNQVDNIVTGDRTVERFAQGCLIQREYVFHKNHQDDQVDTVAPEAVARQVKAPATGSFGPR